MPYHDTRTDTENNQLIFWIVRTVLLIVVLGVVAVMWGCPIYNVWECGLRGEGELRQAEWNRQIAVKEAMAKLEAAKSLAAAEVERAKGVAEANRIIGEGLQGHEEYLKYLWIMSLEHTAAGNGTVVYVPTESNLPILEAGRLKKPEVK